MAQKLITPKQTVELYIGAGKIDLRELQEKSFKNNECFFRVFLDRSYNEGNSISDIEKAYSEWLLSDGSKLYDRSYFCNLDLFKFMDSYKFKFDYIEAFRIFEHMEYCSGEIGRLLEACNMISTQNAKLKIIVPNAILLSNMLLKYEVDCIKCDHIDALNKKLIINSEFCNIKADSHASVWTPRLAEEYINSEGTWFISDHNPQIHYAYRNIYMEINCLKKKGECKTVN